ncbi:MAG: hypothetical protein JNK12_08755 [Acidimicrobiales bacterium]|nr:hypothetical protein [Acidimicrobiales bacterium]
MNTLLVTYDLHKPGQDYPGLIDFLKGFTWWHCLESTWLVKTTLSASDLRDKVGGYLDSNDEVLVLNVTGRGWASKGLSKSCNDWLHNNV